MGTAIKHPVPNQVKQSVVIFDIRAFWASGCSDVKNYKCWLIPIWHRMLYSCTHMATVGIKGLTDKTNILTFISARFGGTILWSSIFISPAGILFRHCWTIRMLCRISSMRTKYLPNQTVELEKRSA